MRKSAAGEAKNNTARATSSAVGGAAHRHPVALGSVAGLRRPAASRPGLLLDHAGADHVHGDAVAGLFQGQGLGEGHHPGLGRGPGGDPGVGGRTLGPHLGEVDDAAEAVRPHAGQDQPGDVVDRVEVRAEHEAPLRGVHVRHRLPLEGAHGVDQHVHPAEGLVGLLHQAPGTLGFGDVGFHGADLGAGLAQLGGQGLGALLVAPAVDHHAPAGPRRRRGQRGAQPAAAARDQENLALHLVLHQPGAFICPSPARPRSRWWCPGRPSPAPPP